MSKKFAIVGSGWRAEFYIRIARHPENDFELTGVLCRSEEKIRTLQARYGISATISEEVLAAGQPDFIVVAVTKKSIAEVSAHWREKGFPVLCETPAALTPEDLEAIAENLDSPLPPLLVAEQYGYYDTYRRMIDIVQSGKIGEPISASVSLAHDYHGASLLRRILGESYGAEFRLMARSYSLPVTKTRDRYHVYTEGEMFQRARTIATVEFDDGKIAVYDFDAEQYHSFIRHNSIRITGTRGEIINETLWYLDEANQPREERWVSNLQDPRNSVYDGSLSEDEAAILSLMEQVWPVSRAAAGKIPYTAEMRQFMEENLRSALSDAYFMLLLQSSNGSWLRAQRMPWM